MLKIIAVGRIKDPALSGLCDSFVKRINGLARLQITEIKDSVPDREAADMVARIGSTRGHQLVVALDEHAEQLDSAELAQLLGRHGGICFLVGGPDGLGAAARERADRLLSLSRLTFTHELARLLLCEQIYRGLSILAGKPYHRA